MEFANTMQQLKAEKDVTVGEIAVNEITQALEPKIRPSRKKSKQI